MIGSTHMSVFKWLGPASWLDTSFVKHFIVSPTVALSEFAKFEHFFRNKCILKFNGLGETVLESQDA
ncbi:MAG: hypothetical protein EA381_12280 [Planctomycetaceae bacterium]|nr:MAG: hypothetical protein EA381_12280 [Planctomycetaceae bacterium]